MPRLPLTLDLSAAGVRIPELASQSPYSTLPAYLAQLRGVVARKDWSHPACSLLLPSESKFLRQSRALAQSIGPVSLTVVVGIGGSNLGAMAISQAVLGPHHNLTHPKRQLVFADTVDGPSIDAVSRLARSHLADGGRVVVDIISKSGTTLETAANAEVLLKSLGAENLASPVRNTSSSSRPSSASPSRASAPSRSTRAASARPSASAHPAVQVVVTTDEGSKLWDQAPTRGFERLPIPVGVGGRFSVFSNVGLFPLALAGLDVAALLEGAHQAREVCLASKPEENPAAQMAMMLHAHALSGHPIHDHFIFSNSLSEVGYWYRQLMGESVGKAQDLDGRPVRTGLTPTVSIGSTDMHSLGQLYLGGPHDKTFRFVSVDALSPDPLIPASPALDALVPHAGGQRLSSSMSAILGGVQAAFRAQSLPFAHLRLADLSERSLGALLQMEMVEMMLLAHLLHVNAFDQPSVEQYKQETRRLLALSHQA